MAAKSGNIAPFMFVNSAKFQLLSVKALGNNFIFDRRMLKIRPIFPLLISLFGQT